jgi:hypothetical protein
MVPYIKLAEDKGKERLMLTQHSFEATNCARMMIKMFLNLIILRNVPKDPGS